MEIDIKGYRVLIDEEDYEKVMKYKWYINKCKIERYSLYYFYANTYINGKRKDIRLHRYLMDCVPNDGKIVDHKDGNTLDCRKSNLRICSLTENNRNRRISRNNTSGFKGVSYFKRDDNYMAQITVDKKKLYLGSFPTAELAGDAYKEASIKYHKEYGRI